MNKLISISNTKSPISEGYRGIRTSIEFSNLDKELKIISVTSSQQGEGKSTITANLAVTFAQLDKKILILDGDLRNPSVHRMFGISNLFGLTDILIGNKNFDECVHCTDTKNLHVLTCGAVPPNPSEILSSNKMKAFIESIKESYDYIFIDTPPIGIVTDAGIVSAYSDGVVFVVGSKEADINLVNVAKDRLNKVNANILGAVLNKFEVNKHSGYEFYNYYYQEGSTRSSKHNANKNKKGKKEKAYA